MADIIKPLQLTNLEMQHVNDYLKAFNAWNKMSYDDDPLNPEKITEFLCMCDSMKARFTELYQKVPQVVKDEFLVPRPTQPYFPRVVKRSPSWSKIIHVEW